jgi:UTP--glucose-1-phosphate uridylyltransferase
MAGDGRRVRKAVIPAAGLGTRFLPATKAQPKEMLPIVDTPIIQRVVEEAAASGIEVVLIVTGRGKRAIEDHFDVSLELEVHLRRNGRDDLLSAIRAIPELVDVYFVRQQEPRGLGDAIATARAFVGDEPFAVLLGDELFEADPPCLAQLLRCREEVGGSVVGLQEVPLEQVSRYGVIDPEPVRGRLYRARDLVEKPAPEEAPSRLAIVGRYVLEPAIFDALARTQPGVGGEIQLTDALRLLAAERPVYGYAVEGVRYDVGSKMGFLQATVEYALRSPELGPEFAAYLRRVVEGLG